MTVDIRSFLSFLKSLGPSLVSPNGRGLSVAAWPSQEGGIWSSQDELAENLDGAGDQHCRCVYASWELQDGPSADDQAPDLRDRSNKEKQDCILKTETIPNIRCTVRRCSMESNTWEDYIDYTYIYIYDGDPNKRPELVPRYLPIKVCNYGLGRFGSAGGWTRFSSIVRPLIIRLTQRKSEEPSIGPWEFSLLGAMHNLQIPNMWAVWKWCIRKIANI